MISCGKDISYKRLEMIKDSCKKYNSEIEYVFGNEFSFCGLRCRDKGIKTIYFSCDIK